MRVSRYLHISARICIIYRVFSFYIIDHVGFLLFNDCLKRLEECNGNMEGFTMETFENKDSLDEVKRFEQALIKQQQQFANTPAFGVVENIHPDPVPIPEKVQTYIKRDNEVEVLRKKIKELEEELTKRVDTSMQYLNIIKMLKSKNEFIDKMRTKLKDIDPKFSVEREGENSNDYTT